jgi:hypothetical protein
MAVGKYTRIDNRRSSASSYCSTVTIVVFVGLCLVGVWMMTSSSVVPVQNVDVPQENKNEVPEQVTKSNEGNTRQFEDNPGDLPEDATKGDSIVNTENNSNSQETQEEKPEEKIEEKKEEKPEENTEEPVERTEEKPEEKPETNEDSKPEDGSNTEKGNGESKTEDEESKTDNEETKPDGGETKKDGGENGSDGQGDSEEGSGEKKSESKGEQKSDSKESEKESENSGEAKDGEKVNGQIEEKVEQNDNKESYENSGEKKENGQPKNQSSNEVFPSGAQSEIMNETTTQNGAWPTQATESKNEKEAQTPSTQQTGYSWKVCNVTAGSDYIPCLDNLQAIKSLRSTKHYEHRERHCPQEAPTCLVSLPQGYKRSIEWPKSREKIWYYNVPHTKLAEVKGHQNWVKVSGEYLTFPGGGTQFKHGALHYIEFIQDVSHLILVNSILRIQSSLLFYLAS